MNTGRQAVITIGKELDRYIKSLESFAKATNQMLKFTIYPGADVIADAYRRELEALPVIDRNARHKQRGVTPAEKEGLLDGLGIASMRNDEGFLNAKIGFDGYNSEKTKKWPKGKPNAMIFRAMEKGTSFRQPISVNEPVVRKNKSRAEAAMAAEFDRQVERNWDYK